jgi:hypothetical protein
LTAIAALVSIATLIVFILRPVAIAAHVALGPRSLTHVAATTGISVASAHIALPLILPL